MIALVMCPTLLAISLRSPLVITAMAVVFVLALFFAFRPTRRVGEPGCGQCGYSVQGLESMTCPECGGDLRSVGIVTSRVRLAPGPVTRCLRWTLLLPIPAVLLSMWVSSILLRSTTTNTTAVFSGSPSGVIESATIEASETSYEDGTMMDGPAHVRVAVNDDFPNADTIESDTLIIRIDQLSPHSMRLVEIRNRLRAWLDRHGVTGGWEHAHQLLQLSQYIDGQRVESWNRQAYAKLAITSTTKRNDFSWYAPYVTAFWTVVWFVALIHSIAGWRREHTARPLTNFRWQVKPVAIAAVWTLVSASSGWFGTNAIVRTLSSRFTPDSVSWLRSPDMFGGVREVSLSVTSTPSITTRVNTWPTVNVLILHYPGVSPSFVIDFDEPAFAHLTSGDDAGYQAVARQIVEQEIAASVGRGLYARDRQIAGEIATNVINLSQPSGEAVAGDALNVVETHATRIVTPIDWLPALGLVLWAAIWIAGILIINRLSRHGASRRSGEHDEPVSSVA